MVIRVAEVKEYPFLLKHYEACNYRGGINANDKVIIAIDNQIIGAVRICTEHNVKVLRGMQIKRDFQRKGVGESMLNYVKEHVDIDGCYCLPYKHLHAFYRKIGFEEILPVKAPVFLKLRLEKYLSEGYNEIIIMKME